MILGIGTDIIDIPRISLMLRRESFIEKIYTQNEREYLALHKLKQIRIDGLRRVLGRGFDHLSWKDIEIFHNEYGKPYVVLHGKAKELFESLNGTNVHISISHVKFAAVAQCIIEGRE